MASMQRRRSAVSRFTACLSGFVVVVAGSGCVGSARGGEDYQHKAVATTEHVLSSVRTVQLAAQIAEQGDAYGPYLSRVISQAEDDADSAATAFDSIQPPSHESDDLRD